MKEVALSDLNLYENDNQLYIGHGDGFLSRIEGEDVKYIKEILNSLIENDSKGRIDDLFNNVLVNLELEKDYFVLLIEWLKSNGIIYYIEESSKDDKRLLKTYLLGVLDEEKEQFINDLNKLLEDSNFQITLEESIDDIDFCLVFSPILSKKINQEILTKMYKSNIPHIYIDYAPFTATLGPAINPALKMHCMSCFFNRRISNTVNPDVYLRLIRLDNKQFRQVSLMKSSIYNTLIEWLSNELLRLLNSDWEDGGILGKSKTINFITDEFDVARILKTVGCNICNERHVYRPLNG
ncbi:hypothetical protein [Myroides phaeus]|uniref:Bacteriocin biosynthesis cyclodehydratase domain-containing protein n=1 Tax=Myroides phaeus TaxID=702745 RepID=A0A1G8H4X0_9FLAO|nr:hypothetical protein [Myroides phaeus]SDI01702.1 hypothetical protein SAMN05421818_1421 [Myroides phaeus]